MVIVIVVVLVVVVVTYYSSYCIVQFAVKLSQQSFVVSLRDITDETMEVDEWL